MSDYSTSDPDAIRADIERTRGALGSDVDALADKVTPSKIVEREKAKAKNALGGIKDRVFGVAADVSEHATDTAHEAGDALGAVPKQAAASIEGAPLAVGLIAFGAGLLVSALLPASAQEQQLASGIKTAAQPLVDDVTEAAKSAAEHLTEPAREAFEAVKDQASEAVEQVTEDATSAVEDVQDDANQAKHAVQDATN
ncbi:DUF3618 domain-containing protein [Plantibacter sp. YIM 135347]|uniref:DUF3618 domain-containing protein n=1 Tax=Plantibacter sp. YIM 135347 TaxID=3423919 RepID=UPI003D345BD1